MPLVDPPDGADDTHCQLRRAHLHGKNRHRKPFVQGHVLGDIDRQCGLAHGRARCQHHQVTRLQACGHAVQVIEACGYAGYVIRVVRHLLHPVQQLDHQGVHGLKAFAIALALLANIEDFLLGLVNNLGHRTAFGVERVGGDLVARGHQFAQNGAVAHDLGVAADIAGAGHVLRQRVEIHQPAHLIRPPLALQMLKHGNHVSGSAVIDQGANGGINQAVLVAVKIAVCQDVAHAVPGIVAQ